MMMFAPRFNPPTKETSMALQASVVRNPFLINFQRKVIEQPLVATPIERLFGCTDLEEIDPSFLPESPEDPRSAVARWPKALLLSPIQQTVNV